MFDRYPEKSTTVTFPSGSVKEKSSIIGIFADPQKQDQSILFTERTPFHPVDTKWPDQQADTGELFVGEHVLKVQDCVTAAVGPLRNDRIFTRSEIPAKRGAEGWLFLVGHVIPNRADELQPMLGQAIEMRVDVELRRALSAGHTGCHLAALALNMALADLWKSPDKIDSLGNPDFDGQALRMSEIVQNGSRDEYSLSKSIKKKGFNRHEFIAGIEKYQNAINQILSDWIATRPNIELTPGECGLDEPRTWRCSLPAGTASIPCGGTHLEDLSMVESISVDFSRDDSSRLEMTTQVQAN